MSPPFHIEYGARPTNNGSFAMFVCDATDRKLVNVWGKPTERQELAETICAALNAKFQIEKDKAA